jgi:hypothetical protein
MTTWTPARARAFLLVSGLSFLVVFAVPLFVDPYWWARQFGWETGPETDLGVYLGRCLGAVALAIALLALAASKAPARHRSLFTLIALATALVGAVHLRGLIEDSQPTVEHVETAMYAVVSALALWCRPPPAASPGE